MDITSITQGERKQYQRLTVWLDDLSQAAYFARFLLKKGWHFDPWDKEIRMPTYMQQAAFTTALVVAYGRPFADARNGSVLPRSLAKYTDGNGLL